MSDLARGRQGEPLELELGRMILRPEPFDAALHSDCIH